MSDTEDSRSGKRVLFDPWDRRGEIPLNGFLERNQFPPLFSAVMALILAFIFFQVVISPLAVLLMLAAKGIPLRDMVRALGEVIEQEPGVFLGANTIGQVFGLAAPAIVFARLHSARNNAFLRLRKSDPALLGIAVCGLIALIPVVQWLGFVNESIPLPESLRAFEQSQLELIERLLTHDASVFLTLAALAITPAICEELIFRGYVQRQAERRFGAVGGILFSGIIFGLYHLRLSQVIPLCVLGIYLGYVVWRTGSLWPAIIVHFLNNALAVVLSKYISANPEIGAVDLENISVPWYLVAAGMVFFGITVYFMEQRAQIRLLGNKNSGTGNIEAL